MLSGRPSSSYIPSGSDQTFRVLVTCGAFEPGFRGGGPVRSVAQIIDTAPATADVTLVTGDRDLGSSEPYPGLSGRFVRRIRARVFYLNVRSIPQWMRLWRNLRSSSFDLLYANSLWSPIFTVLPVAAVRLGLVNVGAIAIAPRGQLSVGALSLKSTKKRLFLRWCRRLIESADVLWHASSERESDEILAVFPSARIVINSDQVALPAGALEPTLNSSVAHLVFISRISRMKNLDLALKALATLDEPFVLDIFGPLEDLEYWRECQSLIENLLGTARVQYCGELPHSEVRETFARYDAFVLPTLGENFGHVIAESLSASCPVICSANTPWTETLESGGGRVVHQLTVEGLGAELKQLVSLSPADRLQARKTAADTYLQWRQSSEQTNFLLCAQAHISQRQQVER